MKSTKRSLLGMFGEDKLKSIQTPTFGGKSTSHPEYLTSLQVEIFDQVDTHGSRLLSKASKASKVATVAQTLSSPDAAAFRG